LVLLQEVELELRLQERQELLLCEFVLQLMRCVLRLPLGKTPPQNVFWHVKTLPTRRLTLYLKGLRELPCLLVG
jgi:hypothetical protein